MHLTVESLNGCTNPVLSQKINSNLAVNSVYAFHSYITLEEDKISHQLNEIVDMQTSWNECCVAMKRIECRQPKSTMANDFQLSVVLYFLFDILYTRLELSKMPTEHFNAPNSTEMDFAASVELYQKPYRHSNGMAVTQHQRRKRRRAMEMGSYLLANLILIIRYTAYVFVVENRGIAHHFSSTPMYM